MLSLLLCDMSQEGREAQRQREEQTNGYGTAIRVTGQGYTDRKPLRISVSFLIRANGHIHAERGII